MKTRILMIVMAFTALAYASSASALAATLVDPADPLHEHILQLERERMIAYVNGDVDYLARSFSDEYLHTNLYGGTTTKAGELAFYSEPGFSLTRGEVGPFVMHRYEDVIVATGTVTWVGARYNGADLSGDFRVTRVYVHRDGRWLLATSHASKIGG